VGNDAIDIYLVYNQAVANLKTEGSSDVCEVGKARGRIKRWGTAVNVLPDCKLAVTYGGPAVLPLTYNLLALESEGVLAKVYRAGSFSYRHRIHLTNRRGP
jgi:hypothetical protein